MESKTSLLNFVFAGQVTFVEWTVADRQNYFRIANWRVDLVRVCRPKLQFKVSCKNGLKCGNFLGVWQSTVNARQEWKCLSGIFCTKFDTKRVENYERRIERRKEKGS